MQKLLWGTAQMGLDLLPAQAAAFDTFTEELLAWNERTNLTAITDPDQVEIRHYLDSLALVPALAALDGISPATLLGRGVKAIDVGAGAGLPGLALRSSGPAAAVRAGGHGQEGALHRAHGDAPWPDRCPTGAWPGGRVGAAGGIRGTYDLVLARAVASLPTLVEYLLPLARRGGRVVAYKGSAAHEEALAAEYAIRVLGGQLTGSSPWRCPAWPRPACWW